MAVNPRVGKPAKILDWLSGMHAFVPFFDYSVARKAGSLVCLEIRGVLKGHLLS